MVVWVYDSFKDSVQIIYPNQMSQCKSNYINSVYVPRVSSRYHLYIDVSLTMEIIKSFGGYTFILDSTCVKNPFFN